MTRAAAARPSKRLVAALKKRTRDAAAGQGSLDFEGRRSAPRAAPTAVVTPLRRVVPAPVSVPSDAPEIRASEAFELGEAIERSDRDAAEAAYRRALVLEPDFIDAYLNLGALLCEASRCREAVQLYDRAIHRLPGEALLHYNRAIALEDAGRDGDAIAAYGTALDIDRTLADAHYNAARLHERRGEAQRAVRHLAAYRRLQGGR